MKVGASSWLTTIETLNPITNQWQVVGHLPEPKEDADAAVLAGRVYVVAGQPAGGAVSDKVYAADLLPHRDLYFREANATAPTAPNSAPVNLNFTAPLAFSENQPIGTVAGGFNATDPDAGTTLTYSLVSGAGDTHNALFTLETNGTLKTATTFDYESNASTYSIRVQVKDEFNATVEGNFTVMLTDIYEP